MINKKDKSLKCKKGFTLTEVLVTVLIIGVLAAIAYPVFSKSIAKARATEAVNLLEIVKNKQIQNFATQGVYINDMTKLGTLTNSKANTSSGSMVINDNYYVNLNADKACASVAYKKGDKEIFTFSSGYETPGLGCSGNVCSSFGEIVGASETVCDVSQPVPPEPPVEPEPEPCSPSGVQPTCAAGTTGSYSWNTESCSWVESCSAISGWCDGQREACTGAGTDCWKTCSGTTWGACVCNTPHACTPGAAGAFQSCPGVCKADGSVFECSGENDTHYCENKECKAKDNTCDDGVSQKQTCDDGVKYMTRIFSIKGGWSCDFVANDKKPVCPCAS